MRGLFGSKSLRRSVEEIGFDEALTLPVTEGHSVLQMKRQIQEKVQIALGQFDLLFDNKLLDDDRTVKDYGLQPESTVYLVLRLKGGGGPLRVSTDGLAPEFDCDFTYVKDNGQQYKRGGFDYKRPYGWNRFAVKALGRYENDVWLGPDGHRTEEASGEWPVSYHGTDIESAEKILEEGFKPGPRAKYGVGIYTSPSLEMVERLYAQEFLYNGKWYKIAFQSRVNPDRNGHLKIISASELITGCLQMVMMCAHMEFFSVKSYRLASYCECTHVVGERTRIRFNFLPCILFQISHLDFAPSKTAIKLHRHLFSYLCN